MDAEEAKPHIVLADDSKVIRRSVTKLLGEEYTIHEFEDGRGALDFLEAHSGVSLVLSDLAMPNMDGYALLEALRTNESAELRELPMVIITGNEDTEDAKEKLVALGATDLVSKPFNAADLRSCVSGYVNITQRLTTLKKQQPQDPLTGLYTQQRFLHQGDKAFSFARHNGATIFVGRFSVINFDDLIARIGRPTTDKVIATVAKRFSDTVRKEDTAAYFGDGQFAVKMISMDGDDAERVMHQLREQTQNVNFRIGEEVIHVTFATGISAPSLLDEIESFPQLLAQSESALQQATAQGKDQVVTFQHGQEGEGATPTPATTATEAVNVDQLVKRIEEGDHSITSDELLAAMRQLLPLIAQADGVLKLGLSKVVPFLQNRLHKM